MALPGSSVVYSGSQAYLVQGTSTATANATGLDAGTKSVNCSDVAGNSVGDADEVRRAEEIISGDGIGSWEIAR